MTFISEPILPVISATKTMFAMYFLRGQGGSKMFWSYGKCFLLDQHRTSQVHDTTRMQQYTRRCDTIRLCVQECVKYTHTYILVYTTRIKCTGYTGVIYGCKLLLDLEHHLKLNWCGLKPLAERCVNIGMARTFKLVRFCSIQQ